MLRHEYPQHKTHTLYRNNEAKKKLSSSDVVIVSKLGNYNDINNRQVEFGNKTENITEKQQELLKRIKKINRHLKRNVENYDPYTNKYHELHVDHKNMTTGAEYPNLKDPEEKKIWQLLQQNANCYAYAMGYKDPNTYFPQPGFFGVENMNGYHGFDREFTCSNYTSRVLLDNPHIYPVSHNKPCDEGYYKVAFTIAPNRDYHLYRQNDDGTYSHTRIHTCQNDRFVKQAH